MCEKNLVGRSDKVFCAIQCKNNYHQLLRKQTQTAAQCNTKILAKNYQILLQLIGKKGSKFNINKLALQELKFDFSVVSGIEKTNLGLKMKIYQFSWYYAKQDTIVILANREQLNISPFIYKRWEYHWENRQTHTPLIDRKSVV